MIINSAQDWWASYAQNIARFRWTANAIRGNLETSQIEFTPLRNLETFDIETARDQLQKLWADAPDHPVIHKWPGWDALCDLCSEYDPEWPKLYPYRVIVDVSYRQQRAIDVILSKLAAAGVKLGDNDLIAGGWPRDLLRGEDATDIDVFAVRLHVALGGLKEWPDRESGDDSGSTPVVTGLRRIETEPLPTQVIEIGGSPVGYIRTFDAFCNMIAIDRDGVMRSYHPFATRHARDSLFQANPLCNSGNAGLVRRAEKFKAKGFELILPIGATCLMASPT